MKVSTMDSMMVLTREGYLNAVFQMFLFLKSKHNGVPVFDHAEPEIYQTQFPTEDWSATPHGSCKEDAPSNAPAPRCVVFTMRDFFDSDHARHSVARRSRKGFVVFLNSASIFLFKEAREL